MTALENSIASLLNCLSPLLTSQTPPPLPRTISSIRSLNPDPQVLAATLNTFAKLVECHPDAQQVFTALVNALVASALLPRDVLYATVDSHTHGMLEGTSVVAEEKRARTRLWYMQKRFNLFREENEGYAKVIAVMWNVVQSVDLERVGNDLLALIGKFSLDTNRVLEIILSAAADVLARKMSVSAMPQDHRLPHIFAKLLDDFETKHVSSVLGAMFQITDTGITPHSFYCLVIVLLRERRVEVRDIWPSLSPKSDTVLFDRFLKYEERVAKITKLFSSGFFNAKKYAEENPELFAKVEHTAGQFDVISQYKVIKEGPFEGFSCQKLQFILTLINGCRWDDAREAILSLSLEGNCIDIAADPRISGALAAFLEALLSPVLVKHFPSMYSSKKHLSDSLAALGGRVNRYPVPIISIEQLLDDSDENGPGAVIMQMLEVLGPHAWKHPILTQGLCRLLSVAKDPSSRARTIMREVIFPASSLLQSNVGLSHAIWAVLQNWKYSDRWEVYGYQRLVVSKTCAAAQLVESRAAHHMRYMLKRFTTASDLRKVFVSTVSKMTQGQALVVFSAAIDRVKGFAPDLVSITSIAELCLECSDLALDVLLYLIIENLSDPTRSRIKEDGVNIERWYETLSLFLGACLRKLRTKPVHVEGVLGFFHRKLVVENDALIITALSDVISIVADIRLESIKSENQFEAQGGGRFLQTVVKGEWERITADTKKIGHAFDLKASRERKSATNALMAAIVATGMHTQIAVAVAQQARNAIYQESFRRKSLKLTTSFIDRSLTSLSQLSQFLDSQPNKEGDFDPLVWKPLQKIGLGKMIRELGVSTAHAVLLMSPVIDYLKDCPTINTPPQSNGGAGDENTDTSPSGNKERNNAKCSTVSTGEKDAEMKDVGTQIVGKGGSASEEEDFGSIISKRTENLLSQDFTRSFWSLKLSDIFVPLSLYDKELSRLRKVKQMWERELDRNKRNVQVDKDFRYRMDYEYKEIRSFTQNLEKERDNQLSKQKAVRESLHSRRAMLCSIQEGVSEEIADKTVQFVLQECIFPRAKMSEGDAVFCAKFIFLLLEMDVGCMNYPLFFKMLLRLIPIVLSSCSEGEAASMSSLIKEVLTTLEKWRSNRSTFEKEASMDKAHGFRESLSSTGGALKHEKYCQWLFEIHERLSEGLYTMLTSVRFTYISNALVVLARVANVFPKMTEHAEKLEQIVTKLGQAKRRDAKTMSDAVLARLKFSKAKRVPRFMFTLKPLKDNATKQARDKSPTAMSNKAISSNQEGQTSPQKEHSNKQSGDNKPSTANSSKLMRGSSDTLTTAKSSGGEERGVHGNATKGSINENGQKGSQHRNELKSGQKSPQYSSDRRELPSSSLKRSRDSSGDLHPESKKARSDMRGNDSTRRHLSPYSEGSRERRSHAPRDAVQLATAYGADGRYGEPRRSRSPNYRWDSRNERSPRYRDVPRDDRRRDGYARSRTETDGPRGHTSPRDDHNGWDNRSAHRVDRYENHEREERDLHSSRHERRGDREHAGLPDDRRYSQDRHSRDALQHRNDRSELRESRAERNSHSSHRDDGLGRDTSRQHESRPDSNNRNGDEQERGNESKVIRRGGKPEENHGNSSSGDGRKGRDSRNRAKDGHNVPHKHQSLGKDMLMESNHGIGEHSNRLKKDNSPQRQNPSDELHSQRGEPQMRDGYGGRQSQRYDQREKPGTSSRQTNRGDPHGRDDYSGHHGRDMHLDRDERHKQKEGGLEREGDGDRHLQRETNQEREGSGGRHMQREKHQNRDGNENHPHSGDAIQERDSHGGRNARDVPAGSERDGQRGRSYQRDLRQVRDGTRKERDYGDRDHGVSRDVGGGGREGSNGDMVRRGSVRNGRGASRGDHAMDNYRDGSQKRSPGMISAEYAGDEKRRRTNYGPRDYDIDRRRDIERAREMERRDMDRGREPRGRGDGYVPPGSSGTKDWGGSGRGTNRRMDDNYDRDGRVRRNGNGRDRDRRNNGRYRGGRRPR